LVLSILLVYGQVEHFSFTSYDDPDYVTENDYVRNGLTLDSLKWAATAVVVGNWMPVTLLSHVADTQLFGTESGGRHIENVLLHALAAVLLFAALERSTKARWPSIFVAAAFALHPVHVESVAWIAERKDVLSAFFGFLALYAYVRYTERPGTQRYLMVAVAFTLGLMSKPMLVTFPFLLLLLDVWPLQRFQFPRVLWEKLPLLALSAADSAVTFLVQKDIGAVQAIPLMFRMRNALVSYIIYIGQLFWPTRLAVFYPIHTVFVWQVLLAAMILAGVSALAVYWWRTRPYFATGWLWFLGTLVPVIGIVQVGGQARADRYTYIPFIGLTIIVAFGAEDLIRKFPAARTAAIFATAIFGVVCMVLTAKQTSYWQDDGTLFQHAVEVTEKNFIAESGLGIYLAQTGRGAEAIPHFEEYLRLVPRDAKIHNNLGILLANLPDHQNEAISHFEAAVNIDPKFKEAQFNLGMALSKVPGRTADAIAHLDAARRIQPSATISQIIDRLRSGQQ
jgi:hypothetical protein